MTALKPKSRNFQSGQKIQINYASHSVTDLSPVCSVTLPISRTFCSYCVRQSATILQRHQREYEPHHK